MCGTFGLPARAVHVLKARIAAWDSGDAMGARPHSGGQSLTNVCHWGVGPATRVHAPPRTRLHAQQSGPSASPGPTPTIRPRCLGGYVPPTNGGAVRKSPSGDPLSRLPDTVAYRERVLSCLASAVVGRGIALRGHPPGRISGIRSRRRCTCATEPAKPRATDLRGFVQSSSRERAFAAPRTPDPRAVALRVRSLERHGPLPLAAYSASDFSFTTIGSTKPVTAAPTHVGHTPQQAGETSIHRARNGSNRKSRSLSINRQD